MNKPIKVLVAIPSRGLVDSKCAASVINAVLRADRFLQSLNPENDLLTAYIHRSHAVDARCKFAEMAIANKVDYVWFIDDDMMIHPDAFKRLYGHQKEYVSAIAFTRDEPFKPCAYRMPENGAELVEKGIRPELVAVDPEKDTGLLSVHATGMSCTLIKREVFETVKAKNNGLIFIHGSVCSEDVYFCTVARKFGHQIWVDMDLEAGHLATGVVTKATSLAYRRAQARQEPSGVVTAA